MYGETTSGGYLAEQPIAQIVRNALVGGLNEVGYKLSDKNAAYRLNATINTIDFKPIMGMFTVDYVLNINMNFALINKEGRQIWAQTIMGQAKQSTAWPSDKVFQTIFNKSVDNIVQQLQESQSFQAALKR